MLLACTRQLSEPDVFSLAGTATLSGSSDFRGITIELYSASVPDTVLANRIKRYPHVGIEKLFEQLFDHRLEEPLLSTTTNEDGQFSFNNVPGGAYHLVAEKDGYGWDYVHFIDGSTDLPEIKLYREETHSGAVETYEVWPSDRHVIVNGTLVIRDGATLLIDKGCVVRFAGDYEVRVEGSLQINGTVDDMVWFTANTPSNDPGYIAWRGIVVEGSVFANYSHIDFAETGLRTSSAEYNVAQSIFTKVGSNGVLIARETRGTIENNTFLDCPTGLRVEGNSGATVAGNLFFQTHDTHYGLGMAINSSQADAADNIFYGFELGATFEFSSYGHVEHNLVEGCTVGFYANKSSSDKNSPVHMDRNIIKNCSKNGIEIFSCRSPIIEYNNFIPAPNSYLIFGYAITWEGEKAVRYPNNYWDVASDKDILSQIYAADNNVSSGTYNIYLEPIATQPFADAGPR